MKKWLSYLITLCLVLNLTTGFTVTAGAEGVEAFTDDAAVYDEEDVYGENDVYDEEPVEIFEGDAEDDTTTVSDPAKPDIFTGDESSEEVEEDDTDITGLFEDGAENDMFAVSGEPEEIKTPLTFTAREEGSEVSFKWYAGGNVQYSTDGGTYWINYTMGEAVKLANIGDTVSFRGNGVRTTSMHHFSITGKVAASGDVTSLTNGEGGDASLSTECYKYMFSDCSGLTEAPKLPATTLAEMCYYDMFSGCSGLTEAPELPATTLAERCYLYMFSGCSGLTEAPKLPATTLAASCYIYMFSGCTGLTEAPELPATTLASGCYLRMFENCSGLKEAPELPATTLAAGCYYDMFSGCTGLTEAPKLPATTLAEDCYYRMFSGCSGLTEAPELPATTLASYCYSRMFYDCSGLKKVPELPATTLASGCYSYMFLGCSGLTEMPELPATTLAESCYYRMFDDCTGLKEAPKLPATTLAVGCYEYMFLGCSGLKEAPELPATTLASGCYHGMFSGCTGLEIVEEKDIVHSIPWKIPENVTGLGTRWIDGIFEGCTNIDLDGAGSKVPVKGVTYYQKNPNAHADIDAVNDVTDKINAIGTVTYTPECKTRIDAARNAYDALTEDQREWIEEDLLKILTDAEARYDQLKAEAEKEAADIAAAQAVVDKINAIGTVTYTNACKTRIDAARTAYDALTSDQKTRITARQLKILTDAEARYEKLKEQDQRAKNALKMNAKQKVTQTGSQINITWGKADGVDGYKVYATNCGKNFNAKYAVQVKGKDNTSLTLKKVNGKAIDLKKSYRIYVEAYKIVDGKTVTLGTTIKAHVVGRKNAKYS
ncbi:MAG: leucine-rich repeat protein, partial [Blautia sp.]|nr:leucine-rich repeat protein [Blautia sp.]